jgi:hypothetical protein
MERVRHGRNQTHTCSRTRLPTKTLQEKSSWVSRSPMSRLLSGHERQGPAQHAPKKQDFGGVLAQFVDSEGAHCSVGAEAA